MGDIQYILVCGLQSVDEYVCKRNEGGNEKNEAINLSSTLLDLCCRFWLCDERGRTLLEFPNSVSSLFKVTDHGNVRS